MSPRPSLMLRQDLSRHSKTEQLAIAMQCDIDTAIGKLVRLFEHCACHAPDGDVTDAVPTLHERCNWRGEPGLFAAALEHAGFLQRRGARVFVARFEHHQRADERVKHRFRAKLKRRQMLPLLAGADGNYHCTYCRVSLAPQDVTIDHIVPVSRGGTHDIDNLAASCRTCNLRKYNKTDWRVS